MMPILIGGSAAGGALSKKTADMSDRHFAVVDRSGQVYATLASAAEEHNRSGIWDPESPGKQDEAKFVPEPFAPAAGESPVVALSDRVRRHELAGFLIVGADVLAAPGADGDRELLWHTDTPTYDDLPRWIGGQVDELAQSRRLAAVGIDSRSSTGSRSAWTCARWASPSAPGPAPFGRPRRPTGQPPRWCRWACRCCSSSW